MMDENVKPVGDDLRTCIKKHVKIAKQLYYRKDIIDEIKHSTSELMVDRCMRKGRSCL